MLDGVRTRAHSWRRRCRRWRCRMPRPPPSSKAEAAPDRGPTQTESPIATIRRPRVDDPKKCRQCDCCGTFGSNHPQVGDLRRADARGAAPSPDRALHFARHHRGELPDQARPGHHQLLHLLAGGHTGTPGDGGSSGTNHRDARSARQPAAGWGGHRLLLRRPAPGASPCARTVWR